MATEEKVILTADVTDAAKTIGELKGEIKDLKKALDGTVVGTDEYNETLAELQKQQNALKAAMAGSVDGFHAVQNATTGTTKSYNALSAEMAKLKAAWRASTDEMERADIGKQINNINDQLKTLDASTGNYQRNVGNYAGGFSKALEGITDKISGLQNPLAIAKEGVGKLGMAFKALIANPVGAVIAALGVAIAGIVEGFKSSETATRSLQRAFAAFEPVINMVKNAFAYLAESIGVALEYAGKFVSWVAGSLSPAYKEAQAESQALIEAEQALIDRKRKNAVEEAQLENEISKLRNKAAQKDVYSAEERKKFLSDAIELERKIADERLAIAQEEADIAQRRADQAPNDAEANDKLAESKANLYRVDTQVTNQTRELNAQLAELNNRAKTAATGGVSELEKALGNAEKYASSIKIDAGEGTKVEAVDFSEQIAEAERYAQALKVVKEAQLYTGTDEDRRQEELLQLSMDYQQRLDLATEFGLDSTAITEEYRQREFDINERYRKLEEQKEKQATAQKKQEGKARLANMMAVVGATSGLMSSLAAIYESDTDASEEELQKAKNLKIAGAVMSTIEGAVGAYMNASKAYEPPIGQIIGAISAATVTAAGVAQIKQLASQDVSKDSSSTAISGITSSSSGAGLPSSSTGVTQAPALDTVIESVRTVTTASEEESLNRSQKVYLVTDELEMAQNARKVRMAESTF